MVVAGDKKSLMERVSRIAKAPRRLLWAAVAAVLILALACACAFGRAAEPDPNGDQQNEDLPKTRNEFENRAMLYHILMDIQDFLTHKANFVSQLDRAQLTRYWNKNCTNAGIHN